MGANLSRASKQENVSTTLSAGITDVSLTMNVNDASKLNYPSYLVIDRVDAAGTLKSTSLWEYVKVTNIVGSTLTITRAQGGSTGQSHSSGAVVEAVMTAALQEEYYNAFNPEHTATGGHVMSTATIAYLENARMGVSSVASITRGEFNSLSASSVASIALPNASVISQQIKPTYKTATLGSSFATTTTGSFVDTGLTCSFSATEIPVAGLIIGLLTADVTNSADQLTAVGIGVGVSPISSIYVTGKAVDVATNASCMMLTTVAAGAATITTLIYQAGAGTMTVRGGADKARLTCIYFAT